MSILLMAKGFSLGISMILPIGSQNAMILNQSIKKNHHLTTAAMFATFDILLIALGIMGGSLLLESNDIMFNLLTWGGILFLLTYGGLSLKSAFTSGATEDDKFTVNKSLKMVVITALLVTFLNPHVYIDTVMIIGSVGGQYQGNSKIFFMLGVMSASVVWFYTLAFGAAKLSNQLSKPRVKQAIDIIITIIMWSIAWSLLQTWLLKVSS